MHVFIDFPALNLSFLSCHDLTGGGGEALFFFLNKVVRAQTGECKRCNPIQL